MTDGRGRQPAEGYEGWSAGDVVRSEWRRGHFSLAGLTRSERWLAVGALGIVAFACLLDVIAAFGNGWLGPTIGVAGRNVDPDLTAPVDAPIAVVVLICLGLGLGGASIAAGMMASRGRDGRREIVAVVVGLLALAGVVLTSSGATSIVVDAVGSASIVSALWIATGVTSVGVAVALGVMALRPEPRWRSLAAAIAALPFALVLAAGALGANASGRLNVVQQAIYPDFPPAISTLGAVTGPLFFLVGITAGMLLLLTVWQTATFSRAASRQLARIIGGWDRRHPWVLWLLLGVKITWLGFGIAGRLPALLGDRWQGWSSIASDDLGSWVVAFGLAVFGAVALLRARGRVDERSALRYAPVVILAVALFFLLLAIIPVTVLLIETVAPRAPGATLPDVATVSGCWSQALPRGPGVFVACLGVVIPSYLTVYLLLVVLAALLVGVAIARLRRGESTALFLLVLGAWNLPRAIGNIVATPPPELEWLAQLPHLNPPQPETVDVAVTVVVLALAVLNVGRSGKLVNPVALAMILVVSTLVIEGTSLLPTASFTLVAALVVVFPVLYELGFSAAADEQSEPAGRLVALGVRAFGITLFVATVTLGLAAESTTGEQLAFLVVGIPLVITITAASLSTVRDNAPSLPSRGAPVPAYAAGLLAGVAIAGGAAGLGALAAPAVSTVYPTAGEHLGALKQQINAVYGSVVNFGKDPGEDSGERLISTWSDGVKWLREHRPPDCAADAWRAWRISLNDVRHLGLAVDAALAPNAPGSPTERDALRGVLGSLPAEIAADFNRMHAELMSASDACRVPE
jgi:hypothetical protein